MKFILLLACLCLYVATLDAQWGLCRGSVPVWNRVCIGPMDEGWSNTGACDMNANARMWWFNSTSRSCERLAYKGCGGNSNRYCTRMECRWRCGIWLIP